MTLLSLILKADLFRSSISVDLRFLRRAISPCPSNVCSWCMCFQNVFMSGLLLHGCVHRSVNEYLCNLVVDSYTMSWYYFTSRKCALRLCCLCLLLKTYLSTFWQILAGYFLHHVLIDLLVYSLLSSCLQKHASTMMYAN